MNKQCGLRLILESIQWMMEINYTHHTNNHLIYLTYLHRAMKRVHFNNKWQQLVNKNTVQLDKINKALLYIRCVEKVLLTLSV